MASVLLVPDAALAGNTTENTAQVARRDMEQIREAFQDGGNFLGRRSACLT